MDSTHARNTSGNRNQETGIRNQDPKTSRLRSSSYGEAGNAATAGS
jgi:hypothetical protein